LRNDFTDLGPMNCTRDLVSTQGATFSAANNFLTGQYSAAVDGLAALVYRYYGKSDPSTDPLIGLTVAPYIQGNDTYQFDPTKSQAHNGDTLTAGGFVEAAFYDPFTTKVQGIDDIRFRGGETTSSTRTTSNSFVGEWIPSYVLRKTFNIPNIGLPNPVGETGLYYTISPELMVQYDQFESGPNTALIFSSRLEALRIGPQIALLLNIDEKGQVLKSFSPEVRGFLANTSALITNHESWDVYTGKEYSWTLVSLSYTFPGYQGQPSHFGVTASYGYGNAEVSGNKTNQLKIGLAAKW
jgi:hypothetical protein